MRDILKSVYSLIKANTTGSFVLHLVWRQALSAIISFNLHSKPTGYHFIDVETGQIKYFAKDFRVDKRNNLHINDLEGWSYMMHACLPICFSPVRLFGILWAIACQAPLSVGFPKQEYWSRLPFPPPGDLSNPGIKNTGVGCHFLLQEIFPIQGSNPRLLFLLQ